MEMNRYNKFVFWAEKGITFEVLEGTSGELIINALNMTIAKAYSKEYYKPPIPERYEYVCGKWNNGFVIERSSDGTQFVWIPVGNLESNGTLDGNSFTEKFGRRNYQGFPFSEKVFHEPLEAEISFQIESIKKYGGFYLSRYKISKNEKTGRPQSVQGEMPWTNINFYDAKRVASLMESKDKLKSHLTFGSEYDSVLEWFIESGARSKEEITEDSSQWGNYLYIENSPKKIVETGSRKEWCTNNIYDFAGNGNEWTQEWAGSLFRVIRDGFYDEKGKYASVDSRLYRGLDCSYYDTGFRAALWIA